MLWIRFGKGCGQGIDKHAPLGGSDVDVGSDSLGVVRLESVITQVASNIYRQWEALPEQPPAARRHLPACLQACIL